MTEITIEYDWTFGSVEVRDEQGLERVGKVIHDIRCTATASDGIVYDDFLTSVTLEDPDPDSFEAIIASSEDAEAAQAQRRAWVGEDQIAEWEAHFPAMIEAKRLEQAANVGTVD